MYEIFKNNCRLCGKKDEQNKNILDLQDTSADLRKTIEKHFSLQIDSSNQEPFAICNECTNFLLKLIEFEKTVIRTQVKFQYHDVKQQQEERPHAKSPLEPSLTLESTSEICDETFNKPHRKSKKLLEFRRFVCDECGKTFNASGDLARHKDFHRDEDDTPFACSICDKKFKSKLVRTMHEKNHGDNRRRCPICELVLKTKNTLRGHMLMHSEEMHFKCEHCEKRFRHKKNLSVHLLTHSGMQPFACAFCNQQFSLRFNLRTHQKKLHPEEMASYEREGKATIITDVVKKKFACGQRDAKSLCST